MSPRPLSPFPAPAATVERREPASPRESLRAGWRWLKRASARLEDSWLGDAIGVVCLAIIFVGLMFLPLVLP